MIEFLLGCIVFLLLLCCMAAVADWLGEPERRESRRRNQARRVR